MATRTDGEAMDQNAGFKVCPYCKEQIRDAALKCRYCGEWFEGSNSKAGVEAALPPGQANANDSHAAADSGVAAATKSDVPTTSAGTSAAGISWGDYWYGYLYMLFCGYLTYCAASHLLDGAMKLAPIGNLQEQTEYWGGIVIWALATAAFAQATYKLARREVTMRLIYAIVTFHGLNVIGRGIRPIEVVIWLAVR